MPGKSGAITEVLTMVLFVAMFICQYSSCACSCPYLHEGMPQSLILTLRFQLKQYVSDLLHDAPKPLFQPHAHRSAGIQAHTFVLANQRHQRSGRTGVSGLNLINASSARRSTDVTAKRSHSDFRTA